MEIMFAMTPSRLWAFLGFGLLATAPLVPTASLAQVDQRKPSAVVLWGSAGPCDRSNTSSIYSCEYAGHEIRFGQDRQIMLDTLRVNGGNTLSAAQADDIADMLGSQPINNYTKYFCGFVRQSRNSAAYDVNLLSLTGTPNGRPVIVSDPAECACKKYRRLPRLSGSTGWTFEPPKPPSFKKQNLPR